MRKGLCFLACLSAALLLLVPTLAFAQAKFKEAPMLTTLVKAGKLQSVDKRLPTEPLVVPVAERIGQYGGTARLVTFDQAGGGDTMVFRRFEGLLSISQDGSKVIPNVAKDWKLSTDAKTLTIYLRKGMRWSDGEPFTADDVLFTFNDCFTNNELYPVKPIKWSPGGKLAVAEKVDDYTVRLRFAAPYPIAAEVLAHSGGFQGSVYDPKHFLKQFHPKYTAKDKLLKATKDAGFDNWFQLYQARANIWAGNNPVPTLAPYVVKETTTTYIRYERNPYYWKVDSAGNQLPYLDGAFCRVVNNMEMATALITSGEVDFASLNSTDIKNLTLYKNAEQKGNYRTLLWKSVYGSDCGYEFNRTAADPVLRKIFQDVRFEHAASLAINREEISNKVYFGLAEPLQATVHPNSSFYEESYAKAYAQYDPDKANALLDEMGLKWDSSHEFRLRPDGQRLEILLEFVQTETPKNSINELVKEQWKKIGLDLIVKEVSWNLEREHIKADQSQLGLWHVSPVLDVTWYSHEPFWSVIVEAETRWGSAWGRYWMSGGKSGEKPPEAVLKVQKDWDAMKAAVDPKERVRLAKEILASQAENLWTIGTVGRVSVPVIASNKLRNVPETALWGWDVVFGSFSALPEQFYLQQ